MGSDDFFWTKKRGKLKRKSSLNKTYKNSILIVCEGEKTEPNYFNKFPTSNVVVKTVGSGMNTVSLVDYAVQKWQEYAAEEKYFENLWCVFDKDSFPVEQYNKAFESIPIHQKRLNKRFKKNAGRFIEIKSAHTNEAFELWYLLHFDCIDIGLSRNQYKSMLSTRMGKKYKKNDPEMYQFLENLAIQTNGRQGQAFAIKNATKLKENIPENQLHNQNPSTNVDILVGLLNEHIKT